VLYNRSISMALSIRLVLVFVYNARSDAATLSLHDALPIYRHDRDTGLHRDVEGALLEPADRRGQRARALGCDDDRRSLAEGVDRSEEHTSERQSRENLVCRLMREKKNHTYCALTRYH